MPAQMVNIRTRYDRTLAHELFDTLTDTEI